MSVFSYPRLSALTRSFSRIGFAPRAVPIVGALALALAAPLNAGIAKNSSIPADRALVIGGETPGAVDVDGQNRSRVAVEMLVERDGKRRVIKTLAPRESFTQALRRDEAIVFRNTSSSQRAIVYWHVSGYSKAANPRVE